MPTRARNALRSHAEGVLYAATLAHLKHHLRFYATLVFGLVSFVFTAGFSWPFRLIAASDTFFVVYLCLITFLSCEACGELKARAAIEAEGIFLVLLIVPAAMAKACGRPLQFPGRPGTGGVGLLLPRLCRRYDGAGFRRTGCGRPDGAGDARTRRRLVFIQYGSDRHGGKRGCDVGGLIRASLSQAA
ncbi:MAG TPA: hypothetical protein VMD53_13860 [Rhizomicrobium sp.]|nr:hypothetical protein [Rhizomicrobium sp.]